MWKGIFKKKRKIALVLGGGGARGIAHLGILKFLEENGYRFDFIVGTSAGGVFGAFYLKYRNVRNAWDELKSEIKKHKDKSGVFFKLDSDEEKRTLLTEFREKLYMAKTLFKEGIFEEKIMREPYEIMFNGSNNIEELRGRIYIVAIDLLSGKDIVFSKGALLPALLATSALPGIFPPVKYKNFYLIDGGSTQKLPTTIARKLGAEKILAVDVGSNLKEIKEHPNGIKIMLRNEEIVSQRLHSINIKYADLLIRPQIEKYKWFEFNKYEEIFEAGYRAAQRKAEEIKEFYNSSEYKKVDLYYTEDFILF